MHFNLATTIDWDRSIQETIRYLTGADRSWITTHCLVLEHVAVLRLKLAPLVQ
jgi:hypothetical protein